MFQLLARKSLLWILFFTALVLGYYTYKSIVYEQVEPDLMLALKESVTSPGYLDDEIADALEEERFDDVVMYQNLATLTDVNLSEYTLHILEQHNQPIQKSLRNIHDFTEGFVSGEADNMVGISGSIASDMTLYGDLRDLKKEGTRYLDDEPYDSFILNLSMIGVGLSASQLLSAGVSTPLKVGASVIKVAKKTGKISKPFMEVISKRLAKTVDTKVLKSLDFSNLFKLKNNIKAISKSINTEPIQVLFKDIHKVQKHTSTADTIKLLQYVDSPKELQKMVKISGKFKGNTKGLFKVLGKRAIFTMKTVAKYTMKFFYYLTGFILSIVLFVLGWMMKLLFIKRVGKAILT